MKAFGKVAVAAISLMALSGAISTSVSENTLTSSTETATETIYYQTETTYDNTMREGTSKVVQEGKNGSKSVTYLITYKGGKKYKKDITSSTVIEEAVAKKVALLAELLLLY